MLKKSIIKDTIILSKMLHLVKFIDLIEPNNRHACIDLLLEHEERISEAMGSQKKHQAWRGGYLDHLIETMEFAVNLYEQMSSKRKLIFTLSDAILVLFLHDLEKPFKYYKPIFGNLTDEQKFNFIIETATIHKIKLGKRHLNALKYIHGEGHDYNPTIRIQKPLAAFVHICDVASARIWYNEPKNI